MRTLLLVLLSFFALEAQAQDRARCDEGELLANRSAVKRALICEGDVLLGKAESCPRPESPCLAAMTDDLADLLLGDSTSLDVCQNQALWVGAGYVDRRMAERAFGRRGARAAVAMAEKVAAACDGALASDEVDFGGRCGALVSPGESIPGRALAECLRASIEGIVDDAAPEPLRPNVVLIVTDDQRADTVPYMPELDRLAAQGVRFENGFVTTAVCTPSRVSILTGQYVHNHGALGNFQTNFDDSDTLAPWMSRAGYTTGFFGKYRNDTVRGSHVPPGWDDWHAFNDPPGLPTKCPAGGGCFNDYWLNENGELVFYGDDEGSYSTDVLARRLVEFIEASAGEPFLAVYAPAAPHGPATPAVRHAGSFAHLEPWRPPSFGWFFRQPQWLFLPHSRFDAETAAVIDGARIRQIESLQALDEAVGDVVDTLEHLGVRDNTLVLYTSDHGLHWGEHSWRSKLTPYEESIRVPFVASYPVASPVAQERSEMVLNIDLAPTIAQLAGAETAPVDGESLVPLLEGGAPGDVGWRSSFLIENFLTFVVRPSSGVRTGRWKYVETDAGAGVTTELYDLASDPYELHNLAFDPDHQVVQVLLARRLAELRAE